MQRLLPSRAAPGACLHPIARKRAHVGLSAPTVRKRRVTGTKASPAQASFSTASHESLDSLDDDVDFKVDNKLRRQIEQANLQEAQERVETQLEGKQPDLEGKGELIAAFIGAAIVFGAGIWGVLGAEKAQEYFAGYLLEQSLSVDNLFVFILVFKYFKTPGAEQEKVLTYGIASAAVLRLVMILLGSELIESWQPVLLVFAGILLLSSYKLLSGKDEEEDEDLDNNAIVKLCRRLIPVTDHYEGNKFFTIQDGIRKATPLLLVLAVVELSDVVFAVDSIPAVFGITRDPFIVYSSNMFAILSLRALYGFVSSIMSELKYLDKAVALVLGFIGAKMLADFGGYHVSTQASLAVVVATLTGGVAASLLLPSGTSAKR